uniref:Uncharacterized protein n=1 Tax=Romanomermis culicivorax TaxID=13658 RepID=A0A915KSC2_ROMCU
MMKLLKSGQKSGMQYCLIEGKTWPSFQKIALRIRITQLNRTVIRTESNSAKISTSFELCEHNFFCIWQMIETPSVWESDRALVVGHEIDKAKPYVTEKQSF